MAVLEPKGHVLRPAPAGEAAPDRVGETRAGGTPVHLRTGLTRLLGPHKVLSGLTDLVRYASDASPYRFVPQAVVVPDSVQDVVRLLAFARAERRNLVFRAAGTSLNGQAQGEDILVDVRRHFSGVEVEAGGALARVLPGTVLARANATLARHGRVLGPDPASAIAATVGGVLANNASGMTAGTARDSYRTVRSLTAVLPSGTVVDTADPDADAQLAAAEPDIYQGLLDLRDEIEADAGLTARIRAKFAIKNTSGYRLDAFLDADSPAQILRGLMIGSQGTLGFVAEAVYETLPLRPAATTALLFFPTLPAAAAAVPHFAQAGADAVELMDGNVLRAATAVEGVPKEWAALPETCAALLVEFRAADDTQLAAYERAAARICADLGQLAPRPAGDGYGSFTRDRERAAALWRARKAFVTAVGGARPPGTTLITEDFAVPPGRLAEACEELLALQRRHGFTAAVAGHAAHGNLHFLLTFDPGQPADVERYAAFMADFCRTVTERFDGSLKAEHGTGRNLTPFLEQEWGPAATALMWRVKALLDPDGILAPHVVLDQDPRAHLRGLKTVPVIEPVADPCIECGFCEPTCPSRDLTTTPRQRIVLRREMLRQPAGSPVLAELTAAYDHAAVDTCAGDSTCKLACPVGIDTGAMMRGFRRARHTRAQERAAASAATHWRTAERATRAAVATADAVRHRAGDRPLAAATSLARRAAGPGLVPHWLPETPGAAPRALPRTRKDGAAAVYYPACVNRIFGPPAGRTGWLPQALVTVAARAGVPVWIPPGVTGTCCATIWHSKGYEAGNALMANRIVEHAWAWTGGGRLPIVVDATSCTLGLAREVVPYLSDANRALHAELTVLDSTVWAAEHVLPRLAVTAPVGSAVLHPTCSAAHLGRPGAALAEVAAALAEEVVVPDDAGCCGFAGDRGMLHEELTAAATRAEAEEVAGRGFAAYLSASRMCEVGMAHATGEPYESVIVALERATR